MKLAMLRSWFRERKLLWTESMWLVMGRKASLSGVFKGAPSRQTKGSFRGQHGATGVLITESSSLVAILGLVCLN